MENRSWRSRTIGYTVGSMNDDMTNNNMTGVGVWAV